MKNFLIVAVTLAALVVLTTGAAYAQGVGGRGPITANGQGPLHTYIVNAYASALGLTPAELETRLQAGETMYKIALSKGIAADQIPTLLANAHSKALDAAVSAGVITAEQASWMKSHMGRGAGHGYGMGIGAGPYNGTHQPVGGMMFGPGAGMHGNGVSGYGPGMMRGAWQQAKP